MPPRRALRGVVKPCYSVAFQASDCASRQADSHHQSTLDAVHVYVVPWSEFPIALSHPVAPEAGDCASRQSTDAASHDRRPPCPVLSTDTLPVQPTSYPSNRRPVFPTDALSYQLTRYPSFQGDCASREAAGAASHDRRSSRQVPPPAEPYLSPGTKSGTGSAQGPTVGNIVGW